MSGKNQTSVSTHIFDEETPEQDARQWLTPDEEAGVYEIDPWTSAPDDGAEELEHPFPYPAGLP